LRLPQPVVAGQSWGGNIVVELAHRRPELVRGVCAVDGGLIQLCDRFESWDSCAAVLAPPMLAGTPRTRFEAMIRSAYRDWPETAIQGTLANMETLDDGTIRPWLTRDRHMRVLRGLWEHRPHDVIGAISRPVLFTPADSGDGHHVTKRDDYERVAQHHNHVRVEWFRPAHHDLHAQYPERWANVLDAHITGGFLA
jgi:pimeloyl-ACP methyl ester carboxylesterase